MIIKIESEIIRIPVLLTSDNKVLGLYNLLDPGNEVSEDSGVYFIEGTTTSKLKYLTRSTSNLVINEEIQITGVELFGKVTKNLITKEYSLYEKDNNGNIINQIFYVDFSDGTTKFKYQRQAMDATSGVFINQYIDLIDTPKIESTVFIDRGVNNVFEPLKKLKKIKSLNELQQFGSGYFKINKKGYNFNE